MTARPACLLLAGTLLVPFACADERRTFSFEGERFDAPPAADAYVLRAGARLEVPSALLLDGGTRAALRVDGRLVGEASGSGRLLSLDAAPAALTFDNPDTLVAKGSVVSVEIDAADGALGLLDGSLLGGGLLGRGLLDTVPLVGTAAAGGRLVLLAGPPPAPPAPAAPTPALPSTPTPAPATPATPSPIVPTPVAPTTPAPTTPAPTRPVPSAPTADTDAEPGDPVEGAEGASDPGRASPMAAFQGALSAARVGFSSPGALMMALLAAAACAFVPLAWLGRR